MRKNAKEYSLKRKENQTALCQGMRDGIPIGLGYFAVAFSLGIMAKNVGQTPVQSFVMSILCVASAGEYAGLSLIGAAASFLEVAVMMLIVNARYLLMSCALSQRMRREVSVFRRMLMAFGVTDELFAISVAKEGYLNPNYTYGAILIAAPMWALGTAVGCIAGNLMPLRFVSAFGVTLFGMFLAVIIPPARKDKVIAALIVICFAASYAAATLPVVSDISSGTRTIILTVVISAGAAVLFPHEDPETEEGS